MSQVNIYIPEKLEKNIRKMAKIKGKSLSAYVTEVLQKEAPSKDWGDFFEKIAGKWEGDFPEIPREPPEDLDFDLDKGQ